MNFLVVALGGALGAMCRYAISLIPAKTTFPILTLITNLLGALLIGFVVGISSARNKMTPNATLFWKTGVCGGFTTFSTFSLEAFNLFHAGQTASGIVYILLSVCGCIAGVICGEKLALLWK